MSSPSPEMQALVEKVKHLEEEGRNLAEEKSELVRHMRELAQTVSESHTIPLADHEKVATEAKNSRRLYDEAHQDLENLRLQKQQLDQAHQLLVAKEEKARQDLDRLRAHLIVTNEEATADALRINQANQELLRQLQAAQAKLQELQSREPEKVVQADEGMRDRVVELEREIETLRKRLEAEESERAGSQAVLSNLEVALEMLQAGELATSVFLFLLVLLFLLLLTPAVFPPRARCSGQ